MDLMDESNDGMDVYLESGEEDLYDSWFIVGKSNKDFLKYVLLAQLQAEMISKFVLSIRDGKLEENMDSLVKSGIVALVARNKIPALTFRDLGGIDLTSVQKELLDEIIKDISENLVPEVEVGGREDEQKET